MTLSILNLISCVVRKSAALTNVWQLLERKGKEFMGSAYKDPITSFDDFLKFSVSNPEVEKHFFQCTFQ